MAMPLLFLRPTLHILYWIPAVGTLARCLSLLPRNRQQPLRTTLLLSAFPSPPVKGNILQGLPPTVQTAKPGRALRDDALFDRPP